MMWALMVPGQSRDGRLPASDGGGTNVSVQSVPSWSSVVAPTQGAQRAGVLSGLGERSRAGVVSQWGGSGCQLCAVTKRQSEEPGA